MILLYLLLLALATIAITTNTSATLTLEGSLNPLNTTHLSVTILNKYSQSISVLGWNNLFQSSQNGAHGSFTVAHKDVDGRYQVLQPASNRPTFEFLRPVPIHFTTITGKGNFGTVLDITELFEVSRPDQYVVWMEFTSRGILENGDINKTEQIATAGRRAENLQSVVITSNRITMSLIASTQGKIIGRSSSLGLCSDSRKLMPIVLQARENARDLAKYAQNAHDSALWAEYFNSTAAITRIKRVYQGIINYGRNGNYYGITEYCDSANEDPGCTDDEQVLAYRNPYQEGTNTTTITLCTRFMLLQHKIQCNYPSNLNPDMVDQGGLFLHELTHARSLVGYADISDGAHANCYSWNCVQEAVAGANNEIPPWHIGRAYELYAYAARALGTRSCNIDAALVDNTQSYSSTVSGNASQTEASSRSPSAASTLRYEAQQATPASGRPTIESSSEAHSFNKADAKSLPNMREEHTLTEDSSGQSKGDACLAC